MKTLVLAPRLISELLVGFAMLALRASADEADYTYTVTANAVTITGFKGAGGAVIIPSSINGMPVIAIGDRAFYFVGSVTEVVVPNSVTNLGEFAFYHCDNLSQIIIPNSVTSIGTSTFSYCVKLGALTLPSSLRILGDWAFSTCTSLTGVTVPDGVTWLGAAPFWGCTNLQEISVDPLNPNYISIDGVLFSRSKTSLLEVPGGKSGSYEVPAEVTQISYRAFSSCPWLTGITLNHSVTDIGEEAFSACTGLATMTFPESVTVIRDLAFDGCTNLYRAYFEGNPPVLGRSVFGLCGPLWCLLDPVTVYYLPSATGWGPSYGGRPTAPWMPEIRTQGTDFGVRTNQFGFSIGGADGQSVVVEGCITLEDGNWQPLSTNVITAGSCYFADQAWTNYLSRFYRVRWL